MREYALMNKHRTVVLNISQSGTGQPPVLNEYQISKGFIWVPVSQVPNHVMYQYRYWSERP